MEDNKQRKIGIKITEVSDWDEDGSEVDCLLSSVPKSEALKALAEENADKTESGKWNEKNLPRDLMVMVDMDEDDDIDLADPSAACHRAAYDIENMYRNQIDEKALDFVGDNLCAGDVILPVKVEWYVVSCDGVKFE